MADDQGYRDLGRGIGQLIGSIHQKREQHRQIANMIDLYAKMPADPTAPAGSPGAKPLINAKQYEMMKGVLSKNDAASDASLAAYMNMGEKIAGEGAKARLRAEMVGDQPTIIHTPDGSFFKSSRGFQRIPSGKTAGQEGVQDRFQQKQLDSGIKKLETELTGSDITDPQFLLESDRHKGGYVDKNGTFTPSTDKKTHIQVETDDGQVNMPIKKFEHLKKKAQEWQDLKRQKTMPKSDHAGVNLPVLSPQEAQNWSGPFRTMDGRVKMGGKGKTAVQPVENDASESDDDDGSGD